MPAPQLLTDISAFHRLIGDLDPGNVGLLGEYAGLSIVFNDQTLIVSPNCLNPWPTAHAPASGPVIGVGHESVRGDVWANALPQHRNLRGVPCRGPTVSFEQDCA